MTAGSPWEAWLRSTSAVGEAWATASARTPAPSATLPGLDAASATFAWFTEACRAFAAAGGAPGDPARRVFEEFGARAFAALVQPAAWAGPAAADAATRATSGPSAAATPGTPAPPPALGPFREHQQRASALAAALAEFAAAQQRLAALLAEAGARAARAFLATCTESAAAGPRDLFDRWIDCAESEWQSLAHGEAWCAAQSRAFDAALAVRARQQAIADDAARLAGMPTRAEVDDLQRRLRDLERGARP